MPSWGEILRLVHQANDDGSPAADIDDLRRGDIRALSELTGRSTIVYAADFLNQSGPLIPITLQDMQGLMETFQDLPQDGRDLILHSPGGQAEATERLVTYMRSKFSHVRVFVPLAAMPAATMWAMAGDEIVIGKHS